MILIEIGLTKAKQLIDFLDEADVASIEHIKNIVKEVQDEFFKGWDLPMPVIEIKNTSEKYHGRMRTILTPIPNPDQPTAPRQYSKRHILQIQKAILPNEDALKRIITHEMIHLWDHVISEPQKLIADLHFGGNAGGHGREFQDYARMINDKVGSDYVTITSDQSYGVESKEYFILISPREQGGFNYSWAARLTEPMKADIKRREVENQAKLFRVKDPRFMGKARIGTGRYSYIPSYGKDAEENNKALAAIYNSGKEIKI